MSKSFEEFDVEKQYNMITKSYEENNADEEMVCRFIDYMVNKFGPCDYKYDAIFRKAIYSNHTIVAQKVISCVKFTVCENFIYLYFFQVMVKNFDKIVELMLEIPILTPIIKEEGIYEFQRHGYDLGSNPLITNLIIEKIGINTSNEKGYALIHDTIINDDTKTLMFLLENYPDLNINIMNPKTYETPLKLAVMDNKKDILEILLNTENIDLSVKDDYSRGIFHTAVVNCDLEVIMMLLGAKDVNMFINEPDEYNRTVIDLAIARNDRDIINAILDFANPTSE